MCSLPKTLGSPAPSLNGPGLGGHIIYNAIRASGGVKCGGMNAALDPNNFKAYGKIRQVGRPNPGRVKPFFRCSVLSSDAVFLWHQVAKVR
jgi:hypothetical protein